MVFDTAHNSGLASEGLPGIILPHTDQPIRPEVKIIVDPLYMLHTTRIAPGRAKKPNATRLIPQVQPGLCDLCHERILTETSDPKIFHELYIDGTSDRVISFPNISASAPLDYVTVFTTHKPSLIELNYADMKNFMDSGKELAEIFVRKKVNKMLQIQNFGPYAGASQMHPHARRVGQLDEEIALQDLRGRIIDEETRRLGYNPIDRHIDELLNDPKEHARYIFHNENIIIFTPKAPQCTHQVDIYLRVPVSNIRQLSKEMSEDIGMSMLGVLHFQYNAGVTDINLVTYQSWLDRESNMRLHFSIMPRNINGTHAGLEYQNTYTVFKHPEETAIIGRDHYHTQ